MSRIAHNFAPPDQLPIPADVRPGPGWTERMIEMADHIGPYLTMLIVERFGGQEVYVTADPARNPFRDIIGAEAAAIMSHVYRCERLQIPVGRFALRHARRQALVAAARQGEVTIAEAARKLGTSRTYLSHLVNQTDEGTEDQDVPERRGRGSAGQMDLFGE